MIDLVGAIDIGASKTLVVVRPWPVGSWAVRARSRPYGRVHGADDEGDLEMVPVRLATEGDPTALVDRIASLIAEQTVRAAGRLVAVGCAAPGPIDAGSGTIVHSPNQHWRNVPVAAMLRDRLGVPVALDDDARLGALGEGTIGAGRGADPLVYVTVSTGIGSGILLGGRIFHGAHDLAGEFGHLAVDPAGPPCGCGGRGCIESYAGGAALARRSASGWPGGAMADGSPAPTDAKELFGAARRGDPTARGIVDDATEALARGIAAIAAIVDPALIVVGGSLAIGQPGFLRQTVARARLRCLAETGRAIAVEPAGLRSESALAGAAVLGSRLLTG